MSCKSCRTKWWHCATSRKHHLQPYSRSMIWCQPAANGLGFWPFLCQVAYRVFEQLLVVLRILSCLYRYVWLPSGVRVCVMLCCFGLMLVNSVSTSAICGGCVHLCKCICWSNHSVHNNHDHLNVHGMSCVQTQE